jgi:S1-C subfamily serine protease
MGSTDAEPKERGYPPENIREMTLDLSRKLGMVVNVICEVTSVIDGGQVSERELNVGSVILEVDGVPVSSLEQFKEKLALLKLRDVK